MDGAHVHKFMYVLVTKSLVCGLLRNEQDLVEIIDGANRININCIAYLKMFQQIQSFLRG